MDNNPREWSDNNEDDLTNNERDKNTPVDSGTEEVRARIQKIWHRGSRSIAPQGNVHWYTPTRRVYANTFILIVPEGQEDGRPINIGEKIQERFGWQRMTDRRMQALRETAPTQVTVLMTTDWSNHMHQKPKDGKYYLGLSDADLTAWLDRVEEYLC